jgi:hypothetical protein
MKKHHAALLGTVIALAGSCLAPTLAPAYSSGPPDGLAGNPPYFENCTACHWSHEENTGDGGLEIVGLPEGFSPGQTYTLQVRLHDPGQQRWGFELTVLDDADFLSAGGQLIVTDSENTQLSEDLEGTEDYLKHTSSGTEWGLLDGPALWSFDWMAPVGPVESVTFYVAGNAANGDESFLDDYIYVATYNVPAAPTATVPTTWSRVKSLYRR